MVSLGLMGLINTIRLERELSKERARAAELQKKCNVWQAAAMRAFDRAGEHLARVALAEKYGSAESAKTYIRLAVKHKLAELSEQDEGGVK